MKKNPIVFSAALFVLVASVFFFNLSSSKSVKRAPKATQGNFYFLFLSDVHLANNVTVSSHSQDAGPDLWDTFKVKINTIMNSANPPAFILYTGDLPEHGGISDTTLRNGNIDSLLTDLSKIAATHHTPLFYLPGNNDALGGDYCQYSDGEPFHLLKGYFPYPYKAFNVAKTPGGSGAYMISDANIAAGYYSAHIMKGLRIISLNSVLWSSGVCKNCGVQSNCDSQQFVGNKEMAWLQQQLAAALFAGDKVYIAMHVPPGIDAYSSRKHPETPVYMWQNSGWQNQFLRLLATYRKTVTGIFYGHTHMDEFRLLYGDSAGNTFTHIAISCPGISPLFGNNPGFKLVTVDGATKMPTDFTTYYATVSPIVWQQSYPFSGLSGVKPGLSIYGALKQMSPQQIVNALDSTYTVKNGPALYDTTAYDVLGLKVQWLQ